MTEWEKLQAGEVYNDFDRELFERRVRAKRLFKAYNQTSDDESALRSRILGELFKSVGKDVWIEPDFRCEYGENITVGDGVYINFGCVALDCAEVKIGAGSLLGPNVGLFAVNHSLDADERCQGACMSAPIVLGTRTWIGGNVSILAGVTVGDNSVIGAGSVVTSDIPANCVAAGNPARIIRHL